MAPHSTSKVSPPAGSPPTAPQAAGAQALNATAGPQVGANPCLIKWNTAPGRPDATAKPGTLKLKLVQVQNTVNFVPANCSVTDQNNLAVPFTPPASATALSFVAVSGKTYTLNVLYATFPPGAPARANFVEDCAGQTVFFAVDSNTGPASYTIVVT
jgi:hypothetical protein